MCRSTYLCIIINSITCSGNRNADFLAETEPVSEAFNHTPDETQARFFWRNVLSALLKFFTRLLPTEMNEQWSVLRFWQQLRVLIERRKYFENRCHRANSGPAALAPAWRRMNRIPLHFFLEFKKPFLLPVGQKWTDSKFFRECLYSKLYPKFCLLKTTVLWAVYYTYTHVTYYRICGQLRSKINRSEN